MPRPVCLLAAGFSNVRKLAWPIASLLLMMSLSSLSLAEGSGQCSVPGGAPVCHVDTASQAAVNGPTGVSNPIDVTSGNKYQAELDVALPGALSISLERHYNSKQSASRVLGPGWTHSYETRLTRSERTDNGARQIEILLTQGDGRRIRFVPLKSSAGNAHAQVFVSQPAGYGIIEESLDAIERIRLQRRGDTSLLAQGTDAVWRWRWPSGRALQFNAKGLLSQIEEGAEKLTLRFDEKRRLYSVRDSYGNELHARYWDDASERLDVYRTSETATSQDHGYRGHLKSIELPGGRQIRYGYDINGYLTHVHYPDGTTKRYEYVRVGNASYLAHIYDRDGMLAATYEYDDNGNAIRSAHPGSVNDVTLEYHWPLKAGDIGTTRVTARGQVTQYRWRDDSKTASALLLDVRGPGCPTCGLTNVDYLYDPNGRRVGIKYLDGQGHPRSQERWTVDELGRTTQIDKAQYVNGVLQAVFYHEIREYKGLGFSPSHISTPSVVDGHTHELEIQYNEHGQTTRIDEHGWNPAGLSVQQPWGDAPAEVTRTVSLVYDNAGRVVEIDGPRKNIDDRIRIGYDHLGHVASVRYPDGETQSMLAYDAAGRPTRLARTGMPSPQLAYDEDGHLTSVSETGIEDARIVRYNYDARGRLAGIIAPDGHQVSFKYDAANRPTQTIDERTGYSAEVAYGADYQVDQRLIRDGAGQILRTLSYSYDAQTRLTAVRDGARRVR